MCFVKWAHFEKKWVHENKNVISWEGRSTHMLSNLENLNQVRLPKTLMNGLYVLYVIRYTPHVS